MTAVDAADVPFEQIVDRWDAIVARWGLADIEAAALLGGGGADSADPRSLSYAATSERRMRLLIGLDEVLDRVFADAARTRGWLRAPNANLGGGTPVEVMASSPEWMAWIIRAVGTAS